MEGDPSIPYIVDAWMRGLRDFDEQTAYEAMRKGATTPGEFNLLRPDANDYFSKGYVPLREQYDNSVSHALEYYIADWNLANFAQALGKKEDAKLFRDRSLGYKHYYSKDSERCVLSSGRTSTLRSIRNKARTSSLVPVSMKATHGIIRFMFLTISRDWPIDGRR